MTKEQPTLLVVNQLLSFWILQTMLVFQNFFTMLVLYKTMRTALFPLLYSVNHQLQACILEIFLMDGEIILNSLVLLTVKGNEQSL